MLTFINPYDSAVTDAIPSAQAVTAPENITKLVKIIEENTQKPDKKIIGLTQDIVETPIFW